MTKENYSFARNESIEQYDYRMGLTSIGVEVMMKWSADSRRRKGLHELNE